MRTQWKLAAAANIDRYLADAVAEDGEDSIHENMQVLAFDGARDAGADDWAAAEIANELVGES